MDFVYKTVVFNYLERFVNVTHYSRERVRYMRSHWVICNFSIIYISCTCETNQLKNAFITLRMRLLSPNMYIWTRSEPFVGIQNFLYTLVLRSMESHSHRCISVHYSLPVMARGPKLWIIVYKAVEYNYLQAFCQYRSTFRRKGPIYALKLSYM